MVNYCVDFVNTLPYGRWMAGRKGKRGRERLSASAWVEGALAVMGEAGVSALAIEPLAVRLGVTKGSFYWLFPNRDALLEAALLRWYERETEDIIRAVRGVENPFEQLVALIEEATRNPESARVALALTRALDVPVVKKFVDRAVERRMAFLLQLFRKLELPRAVSRRRAMIAYSLALGQDAAIQALALEPFSPRVRRAFALEVASMLAQRPG